MPVISASNYRFIEGLWKTHTTGTNNFKFFKHFHEYVWVCLRVRPTTIPFPPQILAEWDCGHSANISADVPANNPADVPANNLTDFPANVPTGGLYDKTLRSGPPSRPRGRGAGGGCCARQLGPNPPHSVRIENAAERPETFVQKARNELGMKNWDLAGR